MRIEAGKGCYSSWVNVDGVPYEKLSDKELMNVIKKLLPHLDRYCLEMYVQDMTKEIDVEGVEFEEYRCEQCHDYNWDKEFEI